MERSETPTDSTRVRYRDVDVARGLAITLVVVGHLMGGGAGGARSAGNEWYQVFHDHLYSFHMAFFFYLSGYVTFLPKEIQWRRRLASVVGRLVPAYFLFALIVLAAKMMAGTLMHVDRPVGGFADEITRLVFYPTESYVSFLWFIIVFLQIMLVAPVLLLLTGHRLWLAIGVAAVLHLLVTHGGVTKIFALHQLCRYLLFFLLGAVGVRWRDRANPWLARHWLALCAVLLAVLIWVPAPQLPTIAALAALPALTAVALQLERSRLAPLLAVLGAASLTIYLMNTLAMGLVKGIVLKTVGWDGLRFFAVAPIMLAAGLWLPIVFQQNVLARSRVLDRMTR